MKLDLDGIGIPKRDLHGIDCCFTEEEIWKAIQEIHPDKAPGPDGFTGAFYHAAWPIIKHDIFRGDPLSPLLFVLAMEALNMLIKTAEARGVLEPLGARCIQERIFL